MENVKNRFHGASRNPYIDLCRFIAAAAILFHHVNILGTSIHDAYRIAPGGWIFVEFFFILSGYFMTKHFENGQERSEPPERAAYLYTIRKLLKTLPFAALGICIDIVARIGYGEIEAFNFRALAAELPLHFLLLKGLCFIHFDLNPPMWFLTGILIAMPILTAMQQRFRHAYRYLICWLLPLVIYSVAFAAFGNIQYWGSYWWICCLLRAFAGLTLGSGVYYLSENIKKQNCSESMRTLLTILEVILFAAPVWFAFTRDCLNCAIPCVMYFAATLCIMFSGQDRIQSRVPKQFVFLGKLSLPLYCLHWPVFNLMRWLCGGLTFPEKLWVSFAVLSALSVIMIRIVRAVSKSGKKGVSVNHG